MVDVAPLLEHRPGVWTSLAPDPARSCPMVIEAPRSGLHYPGDFRASGSFESIHGTVSRYVEELWADAPSNGATLLWAEFANGYVDGNRAPDDIDPALLADPASFEERAGFRLAPTDKSLAHGLGLIHSVGLDSSPMYDRPLRTDEVLHRIEHYWHPYHERLATVIAEISARHGRCLHLSVHSMPAIGRAHGGDEGARRCDVCIGNRWDTTATPQVTSLVADAFCSEAFSVSVNEPFAGQESIRRHSDPTEQRHSLQIELVRGLYMDEAFFTKSPAFGAVRARLSAVLGRLAQAWGA